MDKIKVLIVDDSAIVRQTLADILSSDPAIEVIATASDPFVAASRIQEEIPDVITLDIEMPKMDGITFLQKIMSQHPIPVVICSSLSERGSASGLKAMELGAVDIITKPKMGTKQFFEEERNQKSQVIWSLFGPKFSHCKNQPDHSNPGCLFFKISWALSIHAKAQ